MDLRRLLLFVKRWAWLLLAGVVLAGGGAYVASSLTTPPPTYQSSAVVLVGPALAAADANSAQMDASRRVAAVYAHVAVSRPVLQRVIEELELDLTTQQLRPQLTVATSEETPIINVTASATEPAQAADIANEVVRQLVAISPALASEEEESSRFIQLQIDALEEEIETVAAEVERLSSIQTRSEEQDAELSALRTRLADLRSTYAALVAAAAPGASTLLTVIEEAVPIPVPLPGNRLQVTIFAAVLGLVLATGVALLMEHLDDTVKSEEDVVAASGFQNLADIASIPPAVRREPHRLTAELGRHSPVAESFHSLRTSIELLAPKAVHSLLVTSALRTEGKTTVAANLAIVFAQAGREVLLVDADLRRPALHRRFGMTNSHGLSDLLQSPDIELQDLARDSGIPRLRVLPAGVPPLDPAGLGASPRMKEVVTRLRKQADLLILDSPAMLAAPEVGVLASCLEWTLLVIASGRTTVESIEDVSRALTRAKAKVIGTALNRTPVAWGRERWAAYALVKRSEAREPSLREDTTL